jgi:PAS domain S-box-containing protein
MFTPIRNLLAPPVFANDEDKTRIAQLLNGIAWMMLTSVALFSLVFGLARPTDTANLVITLPMLALLGAILILVHRGWLQPASVLLITGSWLILIYTAVFNGATLAPAYGGCVVVVLIAGLLLGRRAALATAIASTAAGGLLLAVDWQGWFAIQSKLADPLSAWLSQAIFFIIAALLLHLAINSIGEALARAKSELTERQRTQELLGQNQQLLQSIIDNSPAAIYVKDRQGHYRLVNQRYLELTGLPPARIIDQTDFDIYPAASAESFQANDRLVLESGLTHSSEETAVFADGEHTAISSKFPLRDEQGNIYAICGISTDITSRKRAEAAQQESEERFARMAEATFEGIGIDEGGVLVDANDQLAKMFGYEMIELIGLKVEDLIAPESRAWVQAQTDRQTSEPYEHLALRKDGSIFPVEVHAKRIQFQSRMVVVAAIRDITERKQQQAIEERRRILLEKVVQLGKAVAQTTDWQACLLKVYESVRYGLEFDRVAVFLYDETKREVTQAVGTDRAGQMEEMWPGSRSVDVDASFSDVLSDPAGFRFTRDYTADFAPPPEHEMFGVKEHVLAAVGMGDRLIGVVAVDNFLTQRPITDEQLEALRLFAGYVGLALANAQLLDQIRAAEQKYRSIFENAVEGVFQITPEGRLLSANPALARMYGYESPAEVVTAITDIARQVFVNPAHYAQLRQMLAQVGEVRGYESQIRRHDGRIIWISENTRTVVDAQHKILYFEGTVEDITEYKKAEAAVADAEQRYRTLVEQLPVVIYRDSPKVLAEALYISPQIEALIGYSPDEWTVDPYLWEKIVHPDDLPRVKADIEQLLKQGHKSSIDYRLIARDGHVVWVHDESQVIYAADGEPQFVQGIFSDITERKQADTALKRYTARLEGLAEIDRALLAAQSPQAIAQAAAENLRQLIEMQRVSVSLLDFQTQQSFLLAVSTVGPAYLPTGSSISFEEFGSTAIEVLKRGEAYVINDVATADTAAAVDRQHLPFGIRAWLHQPLIYQGELIGSLNSGTSRANSFTTEQAEIARQVADQLAIAIRHSQLLQETQQRAAQLSILNEIGRAVSTLRELPEVLDLIYQQVQRTLTLDVFFVGLYEPASDEISFPLIYEAGQRWQDPSGPLSPSSNSAQVIRSGQPLLISRSAADVVQAQSNAITIGDKARRSASLMFAPLQTGTRTLGVISVQSYTYNAYTHEHLDLLTGVSHHLSIAIENARLFKAEQDKVALLSALYQTGLDLTTHLDLPSLLQTIVERAARLANATMGSLYMLESDGDTLQLVVRHNLQDQFAIRQIRIGEGVAGQVALYGEPLAVSDYETWPKRVGHVPSVAFRSVLGVPVKWQGQVLGVINMLHQLPNRFGQDQVETVSLFAAQAAAAVQNARLFQAEQQRVALLTALYETGLNVNMQLDLQSLLQIILERAMKLLDAPRGGLYLIQPDGETMALVAATPAELRGNRLRLGEGVAGRIAQNGQPLIIDDYSQWSGRASIYQETNIFRAVLGVPITWQDAVLGVIDVADDKPNRFKSEDIETIRLLAAQAAVAIQNARLFNATQRQVEELSILRAVAVAASESVSEDALIQQVTHIMGQALFQDHCGVLLVNNEGTALRVHSSHRGMSQAMKQTSIPLGEGVTGTVALRGEPWRLNDVRLEPKYWPANPTMLSELCVPLKAGDRVIGVLNVESPQPNAFNELDERLLITIAGQIAPAIERLRAESQVRRLNAELERRVTERTAQLKAANQELEAFSYSVSHDLRAPLRSIDGFSQALLEDYHDQLRPDGRRYLTIVREECQRMGHLIDDLINLARVTRAEFHGVAVNLSQIAETLLIALHQREPDRRVNVIISPDLLTYGDFNLLRIMLDNLLSNAWKFTSKRPTAEIELGLAEQSDQAKVFFVRDNGAGFDMAYAGKLFGAFQRLHTQTEFEGTGIGLATVQRIVHRHGGRVWAESKLNEGATFYFLLPETSDQP